jgi:peptidyl-prolyl cis-trans isomerase SurA
MNRILAVAILFASVISSLPATATAEPVIGIAALVNDEPITTYDVEKEREVLAKGLDSNTSLDDAGKAQLRQVALNSLINKKLIEQKIRELDIKVTDEEVRQAIEDVKKTNNITQENLKEALEARGITFDEYKAQIKEQLERLRVISVEVRSKIQISEKEMREYYAANPEKFQVDEAFHARQIFFPIPPTATEEERKRITASAEKVLAELKGGADFAELAKKYSKDPSAAEGGDLGFLKKGELLPEFDEALVNLKPGQVSGLIRTLAGIHIVKLEELRQGKGRSFEAAKPEVEDLLYKKRSEERFNQWIDELRKNAAVEIKEPK